MRSTKFLIANLLVYSVVYHFGDAFRPDVDQEIANASGILSFPPSKMGQMKYAVLFYVLNLVAAVASVAIGVVAGRRPNFALNLLLVSQAGNAVALGMLSFAVDFPLLVASKLLGVLCPVVLCAQVLVIQSLPPCATASQGSVGVILSQVVKALGLVGGTSAAGMFLGSRVGRWARGSLRASRPPLWPALANFTGFQDTVNGQLYTSTRSRQLLFLGALCTLCVSGIAFCIDHQRGTGSGTQRSIIAARSRMPTTHNVLRRRCFCFCCCPKTGVRWSLVGAATVLFLCKVCGQTLGSQRATIWKRNFGLGSAAVIWVVILTAVATCLSNFAITRLLAFFQTPAKVVVVAALLVQVNFRWPVSLTHEYTLYNPTDFKLGILLCVFQAILIFVQGFFVRVSAIAVVLHAICTAAETLVNIFGMGHIVVLALAPMPEQPSSQVFSSDHLDSDDESGSDISDDESSSFENLLENADETEVRETNGTQPSSARLLNPVGAGVGIAIVHASRSLGNALAPVLGTKIYHAGGLRALASITAGTMLVLVVLIAFLPVLSPPILNSTSLMCSGNEIGSKRSTEHEVQPGPEEHDGKAKTD